MADTKEIQNKEKVSPILVLAKRFNVEPARLTSVLRNNIMKPSKGKAVSDDEIVAFCIVANEYGLNPLVKEIHAFVGKGGDVVPIVGMDGWVTLARRTGELDGVSFDTVYNDDGSLYAMTCNMKVKGQSGPTSVTEYMHECVRNTDPWNKMPHRMLRHKAYMQCARVAFGFSGLYDEDEARDIVDTTAEVIPQPQRASAQQQLPVTEEAEPQPTAEEQTEF